MNSFLFMHIWKNKFEQRKQITVMVLWFGQVATIAFKNIWIYYKSSKILQRHTFRCFWMKRRKFSLCATLQRVLNLKVDVDQVLHLSSALYIRHYFMMKQLKAGVKSMKCLKVPAKFYAITIIVPFLRFISSFLNSLICVN